MSRRTQNFDAAARHAARAQFARQAEHEAERLFRLAVLDSQTMRGPEDMERGADAFDRAGDR